MRRDSQIDERTLREVYLRGFAQGGHERQAVDDHVLLQQGQRHLRQREPLPAHRGAARRVGLRRLRDERLGCRPRPRPGAEGRPRPGDAGAHRGTRKRVRTALAAGDIDEATIEQAYARVERVLRLARRRPRGRARQLRRRRPPRAGPRTAAEQCIVLLSNDGVLPLAPETRVAVVGEFARTPRYQGAGSSRVNPTRLDNALDAITALVGHDVPFAPGFVTAPGQELPASAHDDAVAVARDADVVLAFLGLGESHESEGYDRDTCDLPAEQLALLEDILAVNANVVVVLSNGSSVLLPFADRVRAIVEGWLLGQAGGPAIADVLYGVGEPVGQDHRDHPAPARGCAVLPALPRRRHRRPLRRGPVRRLPRLRRRGNRRGLPVRPRPVVHHASATPTCPSPSREAGLAVALTVTNTGERAGREVVQAYVVDRRARRWFGYPRELKGFADRHPRAGRVPPGRDRDPARRAGVLERARPRLGGRGRELHRSRWAPPAVTCGSPPASRWPATSPSVR